MVYFVSCHELSKIPEFFVGVDGLGRGGGPADLHILWMNCGL